MPIIVSQQTALRSQPNARAVVNRGNPLAPRSGLWVPAISPKNLITGVDFTRPNSSIFPTPTGNAFGLSLATTSGTSRAGGDAAGILTDMPATGFSVLTFMLVIVSTATPGTAAYGSLLQTKQFTLNWNHADPTFVCVASLYNGATFPKVAWANQGSGFAPGTMAVIGGTYDGTTMRLYRNGAADNSAAMGNAGGYSAIALNILSCNGDTVSNGVQVNLVYWDTTRALSAPEMLSLTSNPWQILEFQGGRLAGLQAAAGGSTFNVSITESIALADSPSAAMIAAATIAEAMAAADTITAAMSASAAIAEALAVADTPSGTVTAAGSVTESIAASDTPSASMTATGSLSESITAADTVSGAMSASASVSESITAADTVSGAVNAYAASVSESITAADTVTVAMSATASVAESMTLLDAPSATMTATATISESISAADTVSGAVGVVSVAIAESISLSDAPSALMTASAAIVEAIAASDTASVVMSASRAVAEALSLADTVLAGFPLSASVSESISLVDVVYGNLGTAILIDGRYIITGEPRRFTITGEPRQFRVTH